MNVNSRFVVATHILAVLSIRKKEKSGVIAKSVNTNPVVVRRIAGDLRKAGLIDSQTGPNGGLSLARRPEQITLRDVYEAVDDGDLFHLHYSDPMQACPVGGNIQDSLCCVFEETKAAVKEVLAARTVAQVADDVLERAGVTKHFVQELTGEDMEHGYRLHAGKAVE